RSEDHRHEDSGYRHVTCAADGADGGWCAQGGPAESPRRSRDARLGRDARWSRSARSAPGTRSRLRDNDMLAQDARGSDSAHTRGKRATPGEGCIRTRAMILAESSPSVEKVGGPMRERLAGFARTLRDNGFKVGLAETRDALAILTHVVASRPTSLRSAFRSLFCATHSDWERFDEIFDAHWLGFHMRRM